MNDSSDNAPAKRTSITDSPWFWVMLFSCVSLIALQLMDWKYNQRQAQLERQFQGRQWAAQHGAQVQMNPEAERGAPVPVVATEEHGAATEGSNADKPFSQQGTPEKAPNAPSYSRPGDLVISLWPLRFLAFLTLVTSCFLLWRQANPSVPSVEK